MTTPNEPGEPGQEGQSKAFEPMPAAPALNEQELAPVATADRPKSVNIAFILWLVLGAFMLVGLVLTLAASDESLREIARDALSQQGNKNPSDQEVTDTVNFIRTFGVAYNVIFAALTVLFAFLMRAGKNWARITVLVVGGIYLVLGFLGGGANVLFALVELLIGGAAAYFMFRPENKPFFASRRVSR